MGHYKLKIRKQIMISQLAQLEHIVEGKVFRFVCANDAPLNFIKEALFQFQKYIGQVEDAAQAAQKAQAEANKPASEEAPSEEVPVASEASAEAQVVPEPEGNKHA
jgi:hypothetical protein